MSLRKSKFRLKLISLIFPMLLTGCGYNNPHTIKEEDINKDSLSDITLTDSKGKSVEYLQRLDGIYINSPFIKPYKIKDLKKDEFMVSPLYNYFKVKISDLNKDSLLDILIYPDEMLPNENYFKFLQRGDGKYNLSVEDVNSYNQDNHSNIPIEIWLSTPTSPLYPISP